MDRSLRLREAHRGAAGPPHPSGSHPGNERGELSPGPKPKTQSGENPRREYPLSTITPKNHEKTPPRPHHLWPQMVHFYAALPVHFSSGLDSPRFQSKYQSKGNFLFLGRGKPLLIYLRESMASQIAFLKPR